MSKFKKATPGQAKPPKHLVRYSVWIGAIFGGFTLGLTGIVWGAFLGLIFKLFIQFLNAENNFKEKAGDFGMALLSFSAAVIRADRKVYNVEFDFVKNFLSKQYDQEVAFGGVQILKKIIKHPPNLSDAFSKMNQSASYSEKLYALYFLYSLAFRDRKMDLREISVLRDIAVGLNIKTEDYESIKAMFFADEEHKSSNKKTDQKTKRVKVSYTPDAYKVLGLASSASIDQIKKAFRKMAVLHHPDKVAHLGDEHRKKAKEKFQHINHAYQYLQQKRGFK